MNGYPVPQELNISADATERVFRRAENDLYKFMAGASTRMKLTHSDLRITCHHVAAIVALGHTEFDHQSARGDAFLIGAMLGSEILHDQFSSEMQTMRVSRLPKDSFVAAFNTQIREDDRDTAIAFARNLTEVAQRYCQVEMGDISPIIEARETHILPAESVPHFTMLRAGMGWISEICLEAIAEDRAEQALANAKTAINSLDNPDIFNELFGN